MPRGPFKPQSPFSTGNVPGLVGRPSDPYAAYKFYATFTGTGGTALASYTPEKGAAGTQVSGTWQLTSNKVVMTDNTDGRLFVYDATGTDAGTLSVTITSDAWGMRFPGIVFRYSDNLTHWLVHLQGTVLILFQCTGGSYTSRGTSGTIAPVDGTGYQVDIVLSGTSISASIASLGGGSASFSSAANQSATMFGFRYGAASPNPSNATFWDTATFI